jgi:hypothetical protein
MHMGAMGSLGSMGQLGALGSLPPAAAALFLRQGFGGGMSMPGGGSLGGFDASSAISGSGTSESGLSGFGPRSSGVASAPPSRGRGRTVKPWNSLEARFPEIAAEWHPTRNGDVVPSNVHSKACRKVWWRCLGAIQHEWEARVDNRTRRNQPCPHCSRAGGGRKSKAAKAAAAAGPSSDAPMF